MAPSRLFGLLLFSLCMLHTTEAAGPIKWFVNISLTDSDGPPAWGRMLTWDKAGDNLVTYTAYPAHGSPIIKVARSNPKNPTYVIIGWIPSPAGHIQEQSQIVQLSNGKILMAMRNRQTDLNWFGLPIVASTDGGYQWNFVSQLDQNPNSRGRFNRGLWEPFLYVLPNGCVAGFYANEVHADGNPSYSQVVSERVSCDEGATWGKEIFAASQPGSARPGMPGFARMGNGQYILVFEVCAVDDCNIHYKISNDGISWANGLGTRIPNQKSGPFVSVLTSGRILVTSSGTNQISISDDHGRTWYTNDPPAWPTNAVTWPAIYQTGFNHGNEVGVVVGIDAAIKIKFGNY